MGAGRGDDGDDADLRRRLHALAATGPLPIPGDGATAERFAGLTDVARCSLSLGRLYEAHTDAEAILDEAGLESTGLGLLGVWASDRGGSVARRSTADTPTLHGTKAFCSAAPILDHALVTAAGEHGVDLCLVDLTHPGVVVEPSRWTGAGMRGTATRTVRFDGVPGRPVGPAGWYLERPGFWHGAVGVAASWLGGALALRDSLVQGASTDDPHQLAHLGEVEATCDALLATVARCAREIDDAPEDVDAAHRRALSCRHVVSRGCLDVVRHVDDALGPRALAFDEGHGQRVADLEVYVRQDHGRRDSEELGRAVLDAERRC